jgi:hypothetical protein
MLMCRPHWFMVPKPLRDAVWNAWAGGLGRGSPAHRDAILAAVEAVNAKLRSKARDEAERRGGEAAYRVLGMLPEDGSDG